MKEEMTKRSLRGNRIRRRSLHIRLEIVFVSLTYVFVGG